jgi:type II secretory pathway component PulM
MTIALLAVLLVAVVALLVLVLPLRAQLQRQEKALEELAGLGFLPDRVQALTREVEARDISGLLKEMEALHHGIDRLEDGMAAPPPAAPAAVSRPQSVRAMVTRFLREEGYHGVVIDNTDEELESERVDVRLRATRKGAQWRGRLTVDGENIADMHLEAAFSAFP